MATSFVGWALSRKLGWRRMARVFGVLCVTVFLLASNPRVAAWLASSLEQQYPQNRLEDIAEHDAIIVLGGGLRIPLPPAQHTQLGHGSDRFWYAARLYKANKARYIIVAGGNVFEQPGMHGEAYYAKQLFTEWGVPGEAILLEDQSRTTAENSQAMRTLLDDQKVESALLVTSALHMPRAYDLFKPLDIAITPASADVLIRDAQWPGVLDWIPSASALQLSTVALHEYYGAWFNHISSALKALIAKGS